MFYRCCFLFQMSPLSFNNGWMDRNADCCVDAVDKKYYGYKFGELGPVNPEILRCICMGGDCTQAKTRCALVLKAVR